MKIHNQQESAVAVISTRASGVGSLGLNLYLIFVISWFLHLGTRAPVLGTFRIDLILVVVLTILAFTSHTREGGSATATDKVLRTLILYSVLTIPFVEWPGSVIRFGIPEFIKAVVFYYFTVAFIKSEKDLKKFIFVFLFCQLFRVLEPVYLHITEGYWGSFASMANWERLNRLSGAPSDVVNPNGLAFIICTVLPFLYYLAGLSWVTRFAFLCLTPPCFYALALTGSRTGFLALIVIFVVILVKSDRRFLIGMTGVLVIVVGFSILSADQQDRYLSLFGAGNKNVATVEGRIEGVESDFLIALRRPLFGHGLGTTVEANFNAGRRAKPSHNLYTETAQELGFVGLLLLLLFLKSIVSGFSECKRAYAGANMDTFPGRIVDAMQVFLWMNLLFSLASYGLSSYEWYLLGGFSVVMRRFAVVKVAKESAELGFKK